MLGSDRLCFSRLGEVPRLPHLRLLQPRLQADGRAARHGQLALQAVVVRLQRAELLLEPGQCVGARRLPLRGRRAGGEGAKAPG
jgi:hypothetical protein